MIDQSLKGERSKVIIARFNPQEKRIHSLPPPPNFRKTIITASLVGLGSIFLLLNYLPPLWCKIFIAAGIAYGVGKIAWKGAKKLLQGELDMNFLMSGAVVGAVALGEWIEGGVLAAVYAFAETLQERTLDRSRRSARELLDQIPQRVNIFQEGNFITRPITEVKAEDLVLAKPGEIIPADGIVIEGFSSVDNSLLTGESNPQKVSPGDCVYAASFNGEGSLLIKVTTPPSRESLVKRIVTLVEEAQQTRTPFQTTIERFARYYTPIVTAAAVALAILPPLLVGTLWKESLYRALTLLVISCPCALVLASPVSLSSAMVGASRLGALVKGGNHLESLAQIRTFAFDKTGTLTQGDLAITDIIPLNSCSKDEILVMASAVERHSEHPIAQALLRKNKEQGLPELIPSQFQSFPGKGAQAIVDSKKILVGNHSLIEEIGWCDPSIHELLSAYQEELSTMVIVAWEGKPQGIIVLQDPYRQGAPETIKRLKSLGISPLVMLSGDRERVASQIAEMLGIDQVYGDLLPHHKVEILKQLKQQYGRIAMVGDGVNDAPALSASDVGIAVQHHRNKDRMDTALQTADIILIDGDITHLPDLVILSHRTRQTVLTNIILSIGIKVLFIILGASGLSSLWLALVADEGVAIGVILNGIKLRKPKAFSP